MKGSIAAPLNTTGAACLGERRDGERRGQEGVRTGGRGGGIQEEGAEAEAVAGDGVCEREEGGEGYMYTVDHCFTASLLHCFTDRQSVGVRYDAFH